MRYVSPPMSYATSPVSYATSPMSYATSPMSYATSPISYSSPPMCYATTPMSTPHPPDATPTRECDSSPHPVANAVASSSVSMTEPIFWHFLETILTPVHRQGLLRRVEAYANASRFINLPALRVISSRALEGGGGGAWWGWARVNFFNMRQRVEWYQVPYSLSS